MLLQKKSQFLIFVLFCFFCNSEKVIGADFSAGKAAVLKGDFVSALREFEPLAERGNLAAQSMLCTLFLHKPLANYEKALKWCEITVERGVATSMQNLSGIYMFGLGVPENKIEAYKWAYLSANLGRDKGERTMAHLRKVMTSESIKHAIEIANECLNRKYKDC